jgi:hypothetical protein
MPYEKEQIKLTGSPLAEPFKRALFNREISFKKA